MATLVDKTSYISINFIKILNSRGQIISTCFQIGDNTTVLKRGFLSSGLTVLKALGGGSKVFFL